MDMNLDLYQNEIVEEKSDDPETDLLSNRRPRTDILTQSTSVYMLHV